MILDIITIIFIGYISYDHIKLTKEIKWLKLEVEKKRFVKTYSKIIMSTLWQKKLIIEEMKRIKKLWLTNKDIADRLSVSQWMASRLSNIDNLDMKRKNADKYIKKLKAIQ